MLELVDFNDLFVLAVGLSMAYVIFEGRREYSFFYVLSRITETLKYWVLDMKTKPQQKEEAIIAKIDYYLKSGLLKDETKGALDLVSRKAKEVVGKVHELEAWSERKLRFHTKTSFLSVISYDCFLFGLFVLFAGVFQHKCGTCVDGLLEVMLLSVSVLLLHCLWFERLEMDCRWKRILGPGLVLHSFIFVGALIWGTFHREITLLPFLDAGVLPVYCAVACFIGFIAYLVMNILSNIVLAVIISVKISLLKISENAETHRTDMERYREELDDIDNRLKEDDLSENISVTPDSVCTD